MHSEHNSFFMTTWSKSQPFSWIIFLQLLQWPISGTPASHSPVGCNSPSPWRVVYDGADNTASPHAQCSWKGLWYNRHGCIWSRICGTRFHPQQPWNSKRSHILAGFCRQNIFSHLCIAFACVCVCVCAFFLKDLIGASYLFGWINSLLAGHTFIFGSRKHNRDLVGLQKEAKNKTPQ